MSEYLVNVMPCDHEGCDSMDTTPCIFTNYRRDFSAWWYLRNYGILSGLRLLFHLWRERSVDLPPEYYCFEHAKEAGFCWGCGHFWSGCEDFDFSPTRLCSNCRSDLDPEYDEEYDEWLADWAEYPGELLTSDVNFMEDEQDK